MIRFIQRPKETAAIVGVAFFTIFIMFMVAVINAGSMMWGIFSEDKLISVVAEASEGRAVIRQLVSENKNNPRAVAILEKVYLKKTRMAGPWLKGNQLKLAIGQATRIGVRGTAVVVNGKTVLVMNTKNEAEQLLNELKKPYITTEGTTRFIENVQLVDTLTAKSNLVSIAQALDLIKNGKQTMAPYQVADGDTLWDIAANCGLSVDGLLAMNPGMDAEKIKPGDTIQLAKTERAINIETVLTKVNNEIIGYQVKEKQDATLLKGQKKVVAQGKDGQREVTYCITLRNGVEVDRKQTAEVVLAEPQTKVIATGTRSLLASRGGGRLCWPAAGSISSGFGARGGGYHSGIDICGPVGRSVVAAESGTVIRAGWYSGYGKCIDISHGSGVITRYGHLSSINVSNGQVVSRGEFIGEVGNTGNSTGPHLHFEVVVSGTPRNPLNYL